MISIRIDILKDLSAFTAIRLEIAIEKKRGRRLPNGKIIYDDPMKLVDIAPSPNQSVTGFKHS